MDLFYQDYLGLVRVGSVQYLLDSNKLKLLPNILGPETPSREVLFPRLLESSR